MASDDDVADARYVLDRVFALGTRTLHSMVSPKLTKAEQTPEAKAQVK